ncbi:hypothetical protein BDZ85DRAFT_285809 [Elsinoe ampelina]|uniref:FAD/NAD(P)-binding domain-containing protein n=1 Tax=Elsinoe ampelina TaxID=302913 RepID=A0A6A6G035_9PEZI|nr:hypothetical protein BDZ85DRAFT_285809 [Elsinoe ampelina]
MASSFPNAVNVIGGTQRISVDVVVIGGGFGGCYALHTLRKAGYKVRLIEAGGDFGGVWHFNRYPGARVDSEVPLYQLSQADTWSSFNFPERFPDHVALRQYFSHMTKVLDLHKDATDNGIESTSSYVVFATGTTNEPFIPQFTGLDQFAGQIIHPCRWPNDLQLRGKKVGIVGQGASGLQILQELATEKVGADLTVFVRNPPTALPMVQRKISRTESEIQKNATRLLFEHAKYKDQSGYGYDLPSQSFYKTSPEERQKHYDALWARGSYAILTCNYPEITYDKEANAELYQYWATSVRARIHDARKREIMAPLKQFQWIGTKRPNLEMDYYEMIDRPNVKLVNLKEEAIDSFTTTGLITRRIGQDKGVTTEHKLDAVIMATGYDSVTGSLYEMNIIGKDGKKLQEHWSQGIRTYLGMMAPSFPNMFMLYGPQAPSGLANGPPFLELQVDWILRFMERLKAEGSTTFEVKLAAAQAYVQKNLDVYSQSLAKDTPSWWNGANIPGKTREPLFWVCGLQAWRRETEEALEKWSAFELK